MSADPEPPAKSPTRLMVERTFAEWQAAEPYRRALRATSGQTFTKVPRREAD